MTGAKDPKVFKLDTVPLMYVISPTAGDVSPVKTSEIP